MGGLWWSLGNTPMGPGNDYPWDEDTCCNAAMGGHFKVLQWARENGCPWDARTWNHCDDAVMKDWLAANMCPGST